MHETACKGEDGFGGKAENLFKISLSQSAIIRVSGKRFVVVPSENFAGVGILLWPVHERRALRHLSSNRCLG